MLVFVHYGTQQMPFMNFKIQNGDIKIPMLVDKQQNCCHITKTFINCNLSLFYKIVPTVGKVFQ